MNEVKPRSLLQPVFTDFEKSQGYFGFGNVPREIETLLPHIYHLFYPEIPEKAKKQNTYHIWYDEFSPTLKSYVQQIQAHPFWKGLRPSSSCILRNVPEMDELYYSRTPHKNASGSLPMLYGASGNYGLHVDGIYHFPGIRFYRVLIGLTPNNTVETRFPILQRKVFIKKGTYVVFDFDNAQHEVVNHHPNQASDDTYRILLKLHFCVYENETPYMSQTETENHDSYMKFAIAMYVAFEKITRYVMQTGTNPETLYQFFLGLFCQLWVFHPWMIRFFLALLIIAMIFQIKPLRLILLGWIILYLVIIVFLWLRYRFTGRR